MPRKADAEQKQIEIWKLVEAAMRVLVCENVQQLNGFCRGELRLLDHLYSCSERTDNPSGISEALHVTRSRVTAALATLSHKGDVLLTTDTIDKRRVHATLSESGVIRVTEYRDVITREAAGLLKRLGNEDTTKLTELLNRCADLMDE